MKKTIISLTTVILVGLIIAAVILSINLELNIKIRKQIDAIFDTHETVVIAPSIYYIDSDRIHESQHSDALIQRYFDTGKTYIDLDWILDDNTTYHIDQARREVHIVTAEHRVLIGSDGALYIDDELQSEKVEWVQIEDKNYLEYSVLEGMEKLKAFGIEEREKSDNGNLVFVNNKSTRLEIYIDHKTLLFHDETSLKEYYQSRSSDSFYYTLRNLFFKPTALKKLGKETVIVEQVEGDILKVIDGTNTFGYISLIDQEAISRIEAEQLTERVNIKLSEPVYMTWEAVYSYNPNTDEIPDMPGLNVISPTWYELTDSKGSVDEKVSESYIDWAKSNNYQVWALVSNAFNIDRTHSFLHDSQARSRFIEFMISEARSRGFQGINIDFENVYLADKDALTHFVNEFKWYASQNNLILSMDVTIMGGSDNWSKCYDHPKLGKIVDYLVIMTYDEYWQSSPVSGPVASYDWVYENMMELSQVVDPEKLVLGLSTYTRVWRERPSTQIANKMVTSSSAIGMQAQNNLIEKYALTPIWDDVDKLYYATFFEEDALVKMWIETTETLSIRADIVNDLGLGGIALWRRGFETQNVWESLNQIIN